MNYQLGLQFAIVGSACASLMTISCGGDSGKSAGAPGSAGSSVMSATGSGGSDVSGTGGGAMVGGGSGGSAAIAAMVDCTKDGSVMVDTIADFEMGSADINSAPGRKGSFFTYNDLSPMGVEAPPMDSTVAPTEIPGKRCASKFALHVSAKGFTSWGAGFGSDIAYGVDGAAADSGASQRGSYDASAYSGITFWARSEPGSKPGLRMNVADKTTAPEGGKCVVDMTGMDPNRCYDDFGATIGITSSWDFFKFAFADMKQRSFGLKADAIDKAHLFGLQFQAPAGVDFDVWLDDVAFYK